LDLTGGDLRDVAFFGVGCGKAFHLAGGQGDVDLALAFRDQAQLEAGWARFDPPLQAGHLVLAHLQILITHAPAIAEIQVVTLAFGVVSAGDADRDAE
jgi:hypothetical protein